jgi:hypothetical protein
VKKSDTPALPMPFTGRRGGAKFSRAEWTEYHRRRAVHLEQHPDYDAWWPHPDAAMSKAVWSLLGLTHHDLAGLQPPITGEATQQALVAGLVAAVLAGERDRMLTTNLVFDALARGWSDHYRGAIATGRASVSYEMRRETVRAAWRDLRRNGIDLATIWNSLHHGCLGLYTTTRIPEHGYQVQLMVGSPLLAEFRKITADYRNRVVPGRLLLAKTIPPPRRISKDTAAEWHYNVATVGRRSIQLMDRMEEARFYLDVGEFLRTVDRLEDEAQELQARLLRDHRVDVTKPLHRPRGPRRAAFRWKSPKIKALVTQYQKATGHLTQAGAVYEPVYDRADDGLIEVRTGIRKGVNRRYIATHFWPLEVTQKDRLTEAADSEAYDMDGHEMLEHSSRRGRWFRAAATKGRYERENFVDWHEPESWEIQPLIGFDVSASQVQILSIFLGMQELEEKVTRRPHKELMAETLWTRDLDQADAFALPKQPHQRFEGPNDTRLRAAGKTAVMTRLYGSREQEIAYQLRQAPEDFGPGLGDAKNVARLFERAGLDEILYTLLPACEAMAARLCKADPYQGFTFTDPYDGARVRWNPVKLVSKAVTSADTHVYVNLPAGKPNAAGDYPVDAEKLGRVLLPCLAHTMDSAFASFVVEELHAAGVRDVVSVHDCWMVAADAGPALERAIEAAGDPWLRSLGPIYDAMRRVLGDDPVFGPKVAGWKRQWKRRVREQRWPRFLVSGATLWSLIHDPYMEGEDGQDTSRADGAESETD